MKQTLLLLVITPVLSFSQWKGRVVNENNEEIPFASITVKNSTMGTTADSMGYFTLGGITKLPFTLVASYAGYESREKTIRTNRNDDIIIRLQTLYHQDNR